MAYLGVNNVTSNSITVYLYNLDTAYSGYDRSIDWYANNYYVGTSYLSAYVSNGGFFDITGLASNTMYSLQAIVWYGNGQYNVSLYGSAMTLSGRPNFYYWTYSKYSGGAFNLTGAEWNGLLTNINAVRNYKGYSSYNFTWAYRGDIFYAYMYNEAVAALQGVPGYGYYLSYVSSNNTVYAYQLNDLISELNAIP